MNGPMGTQSSWHPYHLTVSLHSNGCRWIQKPGSLLMRKGWVHLNVTPLRASVTVCGAWIWMMWFNKRKFFIARGKENRGRLGSATMNHINMPNQMKFCVCVCASVNVPHLSVTAFVCVCIFMWLLTLIRLEDNGFKEVLVFFDLSFISSEHPCNTNTHTRAHTLIIQIQTWDYTFFEHT